jgi:hypothetical protein
MKISILRKIIEESVRKVLREEGVISESYRNNAIAKSQRIGNTRNVTSLVESLTASRKKVESPYAGTRSRFDEDDEPAFSSMERILSSVKAPKVEKAIINGEQYISGKNILEWAANSLPTNSIPSIVDEEISEGIDDLIDKTIGLAPKEEL